MDSPLIIGVDVGGTNTDAVILQNNNILSWAKTTTTQNVTSGVVSAITSCLQKAKQQCNSSIESSIYRVNIGTTHFINAVLQRKLLAKVAVIRLCGSASTDLPPFIDLPQDILSCIKGDSYLLNGGYEYDGKVISQINEEEIKDCVDKIMTHKLRNIVISGIFSPVNPQQEVQCASIIQQKFPQASITMSHTIGHIGLLERENAAILNEALKPLSSHVIAAFRKALDELNLRCPFYLTQNDGTLISTKRAVQFPVFTFASGATNSMRGAAHLSSVTDAVVVDIGGTSTDVGMLVHGFPREASTCIKVGGVKTNFQLPDVLSIGLGGGSIVQQKDNSITIGPISVGCQLTEKALIFGGNTLTSSDIAVAAGLADIGEKSYVKHLQTEFIDRTIKEIKRTVENAIDMMKINSNDVPLVLVGGGSILINGCNKIEGISTIMTPPYYYVANAVGAALSQISGSVDSVVRLELVDRETAVQQAKEQAISQAIQNGADPSSVKITEVTEIPVAYVAGKALRIKVKAVGSLLLKDKVQVSEMQLPEDFLGEEPIDIDVTKLEDLRYTQSDESNELDIKKEIDVSPLNANSNTSEWILNEADIECISIGAGILGCGGGGSPYIGRLRALNAIKQGKRIRIIKNLRQMEQQLSGLAVTVAFMGAPLILTEKLVCGHEVKDALQLLEALLTLELTPDKDLNEEKIQKFKIKEESNVKSINDITAVKNAYKTTTPKVNAKALLCAEIGGANAMEPLVLGGNLDLPIVDADGMGRAFPELQMFTPTIYGSNSCPCCLADNTGQVAAALFCKSTKDLENYMRTNVIEMGCFAGLAMCSLDLSEIQNKCVLGSYTRSHVLGTAVLRARKNLTSPVSAILEQVHGKLLIVGKIRDVDRSIAGGFAKGVVKIQGYEDHQGLNIDIQFQNEYLIAKSISPKSDAQILACVPDLISLVDADTGEPVTTDDIKYGLRVAVITMPCAPILKQPQALAFVGPQAFGIDISESDN